MDRPYRQVRVVRQTAKYRWVQVEDRRYKTGWRPVEKVERDYMLEMWERKMVDNLLKPNPLFSMISSKDLTS